MESLLASPVSSRNMVRKVSTAEKMVFRRQRASFMAVMDPWNPPVRIKTPEPSSADIPWSDWRAWLSAFSAAVPLFLLSYSSCVSYAHLIVSSATSYPIRAVVIMSMHLVSSGLTGLIIPVRSKCPLIIPSADISVTIFYQKIVSDIVMAADGASKEIVAATVMLALPFNTLLMSLVFYLVGQQKLTVVVSYLPYPVVAGFLGSIGLAIFLGSFAVLKEGLAGFGGILKAAEERPYELLCAAGMAIGSILLKYAGLPARVLAVAPTLLTLVVFWSYVMMSGISLDEWRQEGWLFPAADFEPFTSIWSEQQLALVSWKLLPPRIATFLGLGFVLVLSLTLRIAGIEGSTGSAISVDDEVKWTGIASGLAGACGTVIGSASPGLTTFNLEAGSSTVQAAVLTAVLQLLLWLSGFPVMNMFPRFLLSGILMNLGLVMLQEWMWIARHKVGILGLLVIYAQVASSMMYGLLPSVLVGVAVALLTAQAQLMKLHVLKYHVSRCSVRTNLQRNKTERMLLSEHGQLIECLGLEGFLAEGPIIKLSNYVRHYVESNKMLRFMIFDLQACQGCNISAYALLAKLDKVLKNEGIEALYSSLDADMSAGLKSFGVPASRIFDTMCGANSSFLQALERCEDMLLESILEGFQRQISPILEVSDLPTLLMQPELEEFLGLSQEQAAKLIKAGEICHKEANTRLARQGIVEGEVYIAVPKYSQVVETVDVGSNSGAEQEVSLSRLGFICGLESVLYDEPARATCRVLTPSQLLKVEPSQLQKVVSEDPSIGNCLSRIATRQLLRQSDALQQALQLSEGGGWKGGHFDRHTAQKCMKMIDQEQGDCEESKQMSPNLGTLSSPTVIRRRRPLSPKGRVFRASTIENWSLNWLENRENRQSM